MKQETIDIEQMDLLNKTLDMKNAGHRLAQICATKTKAEGFVLLYTFAKDDALLSLRFTTDGAKPIESISWLYGYAFLYENEMKDLFGLSIINMSLDFGGHLYKTSVKHPFAPAENENGATDNG